MSDTSPDPTYGWRSTMMVCRACSKTWLAIHPTSCEYLQCPSCGDMRNNPAPFIDPDGGIHWAGEPIPANPPKDPSKLIAYLVILIGLMILAIAITLGFQTYFSLRGDSAPLPPPPAAGEPLTDRTGP
jgi:hypothetical protein